MHWKHSVAAGLIIVLALGGQATSAQKSASDLYERGRLLLQSGKFDEAIETLSKALELLPPDERNAHVVSLTRAQAYIGKGDLDSAWKDVRRVLQSDQADGESKATALQLRGILNMRRNRVSKAREYFTDAIKTPHTNPRLRSSCFANRAISYINLDQPDRAISDLNKAIELDPESAFAYAARAMAHLRHDKIEMAREDTERALSMHPEPEAERIARKVLKELSVSATGRLTVSVPLDTRGHIFVQVRFKKKGTPHRFLLDTGATSTLIDPELLEDIKRETTVEKVGRAIVRTADGSSYRATRYRVETAFLFHLPLGQIEVLVLEKKKQRITNLLGVQSLRNVTVSIDSSKKTAVIKRVESE